MNDDILNTTTKGYGGRASGAGPVPSPSATGGTTSINPNIVRRGHFIITFGDSFDPQTPGMALLSQNVTSFELVTGTDSGVVIHFNVPMKDTGDFFKALTVPMRHDIRIEVQDSAGNTLYTVTSEGVLESTHHQPHSTHPSSVGFPDTLQCVWILTNAVYS